MMTPIAPLAMSYTATKTLTTIVIAVCVGVILAALYNFYVRRVPGGVVRLLLSRGALSPETALTAEELGILNKPFSLWELMRGITLRRLVAVAPEAPCDAPEGEESADGEESQITIQTRFYIPEDKKDRAEIRFNQEGNGVLGLVLTCALTVVLGFLLIKLIPLGLSMIEGLL